MNPISPRIAKRLDLFRLAGDVIGFAVLHVAAGRGPLEVGVELDVVWAGELHPRPNPKPDVQVSKHPAFQMFLDYLAHVFS